MATDLKKWLTVSEATKHVPVNRLRLFRDIKGGKLPARRIGWMYVIRLADLITYKKTL
ncbi:hypothetical protein LCGC14_2372350 [marine sediment metagenome]|uniref:Helix-turn-helix domain-containing protein n=1 Tax=marine sediment metagenome TaxID=412755 RepID=A0A0F9EY44_9ZZZZ